MELESNATALFVFLEAIGVSGHFSDNSILLLPKHRHTVTFKSRNSLALGPAAFKATLRIRSLYDTLAYTEGVVSVSPNRRERTGLDREVWVSGGGEGEWGNSVRCRPLWYGVGG